MSPADEAELDRAIVDAHGRGDGHVLADLYEQAAHVKQEAGDREACAFLLTQAYVFALENNHPRQLHLHAALVKLGREE